MKISLKHNKRFPKNNKGFTLVELVVVFFIMASVLAVVIPGYLEYSTKLELENLALDVALTIREAQGYGAGSKVSSVGVFDTPYGIHFNVNDPTHFIFFEDTNKDYKYVSADDYEIDPYEIKNGYAIDSLCATRGGSENCIAGGVYDLDIVFKRPNPDAIITIHNSGGSIIGGGYQDSAKIELISPDQTTSTIAITSLGAISIIGN